MIRLPGLPLGNGSGGLISHVVERERGTPVTAGSCDGVFWAPDKTVYTGSSPWSQDDLIAGDCYRWRLNLTDGQPRQLRLPLRPR